MLRRSLSNIKDCSTTGSESNCHQEFPSSHRSVAPTVAATETAQRKQSSMTTVSAATVTHIPSNVAAARPVRIARRPLNEPVPEQPITSRPVQGDAAAAGVSSRRPERRSCSLDSKRSSTRAQYQALSASVLLAETSAGMSTTSRLCSSCCCFCRLCHIRFHHKTMYVA